MSTFSTTRAAAYGVLLVCGWGVGCRVTGVDARSASDLLLLQPPPPRVTPVTPGPEPVFNPLESTMLWRNDFDDQQGAATQGIPIATSAFEFAQIRGGGSSASFSHVEPGAGVAGSAALRLDWIRDTSCTDDGRGIVAYLAGAPTEYTVQFSVRYQPGFIWDWLYSGQAPCRGTAKKIFRTFTGQSGTLPGFFFENESHVMHAGSDWNEPRYGQNAGGAPVTLEQLTDGEWHRFTFHILQSSRAGATDGWFAGWLDGTLRWFVPHWDSGTPLGPAGFRVAGTFNAGAPANQSEWIDAVSVWRP